MANILGLALKVSADGSGVPAALTPVERALQSLEKQSAKVTAVFAEFAGTSDAAARAQAATAESLTALREQLANGEITAQQFAETFAALGEAAEREADSLRRAAEITASNISPIQEYEQAFAELTTLLREGKITQETYNAELGKIRKTYDDATGGASTFDEVLASQNLKLNELTGIFAALPGPLGNIAGRFSGLASAGEGLSRVFAGGLQQGITNVAASITGLINPFTIAAAGVAAFGAAATAITNGLADLEGRVESLGNTASKLGVSFEFVQVLEEAGKRSGTSIDAVSAAFGRLQTNILGVDEESKKARTALDSIGVTVEELQALAPEEQYLLIGQRLAEIEDPAKRTAAATQLFGKAGADLIPFFDNINKAQIDIERFGATISNLDRSRLDALGDGFDQIGLAVQALGQKALLPFAGLVEGVSKTISAVVNVVGLVADALGFVLQPVLDAVGRAFSIFGDAVNNTIGFFRSFFRTAEETGNATAQVTDNLGRSAEEVDALAKAIQASGKSLDDAIAKAGEFGQAGFDAAFQFQEAIADLQEQVDEGELNAEQYARGVALATAEYEKQIDVARDVAEQNKRMAEEAQRRADAEAKAVQDLIDAYTEQLRIQEQFGGDDRRAEAADKVLLIEREIVKVQEQLAKARRDGDREAANAAASRLATLDQILSQEQDIASGAAAAREAAELAAQQAAENELKRREQLAQDLQKLNEQTASKQAELLERQFEIEKDRAEELSRIRIGSIEVEDIREGGIGAFFDALREDPAIGEARRQTRELEAIRKELAKLQAQKVDILAGTG